MRGPLDGVKVVELGVWVAGPAAGGILTDWGASTIKIEPLTGDPSRTFAQLLGGDIPTNPIFEMDNRGKRSIALDLSTEAGQEVAHRLLEEADVFVTNVRLAGLERLGLDPETVFERHPHLIVASITGYGHTGPDADRAAYDIAAFWARSGIASLLTPEGADLPFQRGGMGDHNTGLATAGAICAALFARERAATDHGQILRTSLLREGVYTISFDLSVLVGWGVSLRVGQRTDIGPTANNYTAGDGQRFWIVGLEPDRHWPPLCRAVEREEWLTDERFATPADRHVNAPVLIPMLDEVFATRPLEEWAERFDAEPDLFWARVRDIDDALADEQFHAAGAFVEVPDEVGTSMSIATPADFEGTPWSPAGPAPRLGQHSAEILEHLGMADRVDELVRAGVLGTDPG